MKALNQRHLVDYAVFMILFVREIRMSISASGLYLSITVMVVTSSPETGSSAHSCPWSHRDPSQPGCRWCSAGRLGDSLITPGFTIQRCLRLGDSPGTRPLSRRIKHQLSAPGSLCCLPRRCYSVGVWNAAS